ncbi:MAG: hypothetical protein AAFY48_24625 [Bacteroidota bacterium]
MWDFIQEIKLRNETLYYFGLVNLAAFLVFMLLSRITDTQVYNISAWYKPAKFALSTMLYAWAMAWYCHYLKDFNIGLFNWSVIILLGFEVVYIAIQAGRGLLSHYNQSTPFYGMMFSLMALAATLVTLYTAYVTLRFFTDSFPQLPTYYLWGIRLGLVIFVIFSFEGFVMGGRMTHTIGGPDGGPGIPFLNWSYEFGDPRIAHFIGMHALQVLPILGYYLLQNVRWVVVVAVLYALLATYTLLAALRGTTPI